MSEPAWLAPLRANFDATVERVGHRRVYRFCKAFLFEWCGLTPRKPGYRDALMWLARATGNHSAERGLRGERAGGRVDT